MVVVGYSWWVGVIVVFFVLFFVLCILGVVFLRKFGYFKFEGFIVKNIVVEIGGYIQSTVVFLKFDNDSGYNSDDINDEYVTSERDISCVIFERLERVKYDDFMQNVESKL